ncbi:hypothetical protein PR003_g32531 [Phytophthora rubi]|uniref:Uncharacterized protein n=1 Tax=Phytophthora rubi TaxID=129364 RepID=A0A6A4B2D8_9STRA|nr:hypothetical protein PR003_g32531 [Phytophthora rubi]
MPEVAEAADMDIDGGSQSTSYVGSSPPSSPRSPATTLGSEFPYSLASEVETEWSQEVSEAPSRMTATAAGNHHQTAQAGTSSASLENDLSQDGFIIEKVAPAPGMPQQLPVFLMPFSGALTAVPANGQCAYTALYATTTSTDETDLQFTQEVTRGANIIKRSVYTLMLTNLANDVACKVVDPCRELRRLYPTQPAPPDTAVSTAALA